MNDARDRESDDIPYAATGLAAPKMLQASPQHHGYVMRLRVSPFYAILPRLLQKLISRLWSAIASFVGAPRWERRYLLLLGSYLYKFEDATRPNPKGSPVPLEAVDVHLINLAYPDDVDTMGEESLRQLPVGYGGVFVVCTLRKKYYYATSSREEALTWVNSIRQARQEAITRSMGHAPSDSYPKSWEYYDQLGTKFVKTKDRIRAKVEEMEMTSSFGETSGPLPRGYFG